MKSIVTRITDVLAVPVTGAYYFEDLSALQAGATSQDSSILREVPAAVSVGLVLDDGRVAWGDCVGAVGFDAAGGTDSLQEIVAPALRGRALTRFRALAQEIDALTEWVEVTRPVAPPPAEPPGEAAVADPSRRQLLSSVARLLTPYEEDEGRSKAARPEQVLQIETVERPLHPAVRYGVSQALLRAVALARGVTMAEVLADEWELPEPERPVPLLAQSGRERYLSADKMIVRRVASLPRAPVENVADQVGQNGAKLTRYVGWLCERIETLGGADYRPTIHLDLQGALGQIFDHNLGKVLGQLYAMELAAQPYPLRVENPVITESPEAQIEAFKTLRDYVRLRKMNVALVADAWAHTLPDLRALVEAEAADMIHVRTPELGSLHNAVAAVLICRAGGVGTLLGGSRAETDLAARTAAHVALATRPDLLLAKPGSGVDEAISIVQNEMRRTLAHLQARPKNDV